MKEWDGAAIAKPIVDRGISAWSVMAEEVERSLPKLVTDVEARIASAPWGGGMEGEAFIRTHFRDGGPGELLNQCGRLAKEITDAGDRLRTAIDNTLQTDADIRHDLTALARQREV
ncbi:hypothetical protein GCM10009733_087800 [Nonomuraea maheshkhaliensis]|uniref:WXG100 family type VII secretion target n=1 Tax=Nonomuraea maheshkhaliensis TaxID=419590 RepID=A0ABP4SW58_9ACTN